MASQQLAFNQVIMNRKQNIKGNLPFLFDNKFEVRVKNHVVEGTYGIIENFKENEEELIDTLREKNNTFFNVTIKELASRYPNFSMPIYFSNDGNIIYNAHSFIEGVWHFNDFNDFWKQIKYLQEDLPEIFRQEESSLTFKAKKGKISSLHYKYYVNDMVTYSSIPRAAVIDNDTEYMMIHSAAKEHGFCDIKILEKDNKGRLLKWRIDKMIKF